MSKFFKNKFSYNHVFLLTIIAGYLLLLLSFFCLSQIYSTPTNNVIPDQEYLIELKQNTTQEQRSHIIDSLNQNEDINKVVMIPKEKVLDFFDIQIPDTLRDSINNRSPFSDHISLLISSDKSDSVIAVINAMERVARINSIIADEISNLDNTSSVRTSSKSAYIIYTILLLLVMSIIYIGLSLDFERNSKSLKKLLLDGATPAYLQSNYQKKGLSMSIKSWIVALFLFILTVYLLKSAVLDGNLTFSVGFWSIVCLIPLALIIFVTSIVIYTKIKTIINT